MRNRTASVLITGALLTGAATAVVITPVSAATSDNPVVSRLASIKQALSGLVTDGTLTQAQADKVATTLDEELPARGPGGPGGHHGMGADLDAAASALGMTTDELRTALDGDTTLADVAKTQGVAVEDVVAALVAAAKQELADAVAAGRLTQAQADEITTTLTQRVTDRVNGVRPERGTDARPDGPRGGPGWGHGGGAPDQPAPGASTPAPSPSGSATTS